MNFSEEVEKVINNEYDYSNIVPNIDNISFLVRYFDSVFSWFHQLLLEDEQRNEKLKYEYQNYNYKKSYGTVFDVKVRQKGTYGLTSYKNFNSFNDAVMEGQLNNIDSLEIELNLDYKRGNNDSLDDYQNLFKVSFKPYNINFIRKSNHNEQNMNEIEENIKQMLNGFQTINTIFCTK